MKNQIWILYMDGNQERIRFTDVEIQNCNINQPVFILEAQRGYKKLGYIKSRKAEEAYDVYYLPDNSFAVIMDYEDFDFYREFPTYANIARLFKDDKKFKKMTTND